MKIKYVGPNESVEVHTPAGYVGATRGVPVDFPADTAKNLLEQDVWEPVEKAVPAAVKSQED